MAGIITRSRADLRAGKRLQEVRTHRGMSQGLLAAESGFSRSAIKAYEHGRLPISARHYEVFARVLQCDVHDLKLSPGSAKPRVRVRSEAQHAQFSPAPQDWIEAIGYYSRDGRMRELVHLCDQAKIILGIPADRPGQISWAKWFALCHPEDHFMVKSELNRLEQTGRFGLLYRQIGLDGVERDVVDCSGFAYDARHQSIRLQGTLIWVKAGLRGTPAVEREIAGIIAAARKN